MNEIEELAINDGNYLRGPYFQFITFNIYKKAYISLLNRITINI